MRFNFKNELHSNLVVYQILFEHWVPGVLTLALNCLVR